MHNNHVGEMVFDDGDLCDLVMQGREPWHMPRVTVTQDVDLQGLISLVERPEQMVTWTFAEGSDIAIPQFDRMRQSRWFMPDQYRDMDIAAHVLDLCTTQEQLQRVGQELLMFQERGLLDLLRYLKYLVDVMRDNRVIWGVGRGSSVASYVLYLMGVHRIDSLYYDLDPGEFLR